MTPGMIYSIIVSHPTREIGSSLTWYFETHYAQQRAEHAARRLGAPIFGTAIVKKSMMPQDDFITDFDEFIHWLEERE